jgi:clan AA aspartic protease
MISGIVTNREATIDLEVSGAGQSRVEIKAVVDTGYNGYLTLDGDLVSALQLPFAGHRRGTLADGSIANLEVYIANVSWHGREKDVLVLRTQGMPLVGMALLEGSRLTIDVVADGRLTIDELSQSS